MLWPDTHTSMFTYSVTTINKIDETPSMLAQFGTDYFADDLCENRAIHPCQAKSKFTFSKKELLVRRAPVDVDPRKHVPQLLRQRLLNLLYLPHISGHSGQLGMFTTM